MTLPFATMAMEMGMEPGTWTAGRNPEVSRAAECLLPAVGASVSDARALVHRELRRWECDDLVDDCSIIVSELVTNVIRHAGTAFALRLRGHGSRVYGEIFDTGDGVPRQRDPGLDSTDGRGLLIVDTLADEWGCAPALNGGKIVWFVISR